MSNRWRSRKRYRPKKSKTNGVVPRETLEGSALIEWVDMVGYPLNLLYHIANEGTGSPVRGRKLKAEGLRPGVADYCLPIARHGWNALYIELKALDGEPSDAQVRWCKDMIIEKNMALVVRGWPRAAEILAYYSECAKALRMLP